MSENPETEEILKNYTRDELAKIVVAYNRHKQILRDGQKKYKQKPEVIEQMRKKNAELYNRKHNITERDVLLKKETKALKKAEKTFNMIKETMPDNIEGINKVTSLIEEIKGRIASLNSA